MDSPALPRFCVPATWLTVDLPTGLSIYYELAPDGSLKTRDRNGAPVPHHVRYGQPDSNTNCRPVAPYRVPDSVS
jgi:hypothetical protein